MYTAVAFDLDGTLLDTLEDLARACNHTLAKMGLPTHPTQAYKKMVGNGVRRLVERMLPADRRDSGTVDQAYDCFSQYYAAHMEDCTKPYAGIGEAVAQLRAAEVPLGVLSNKADAYTRHLAERFFPGAFLAVRGQREGVPTKPDPAALFLLLDEMGARPGSTLFVGDSGVDMQTARNAGLDGCGVLWGFRGQAELLESGAVHIAETPDDLVRLVVAGR